MTWKGLLLAFTYIILYNSEPMMKTLIYNRNASKQSAASLTEGSCHLWLIPIHQTIKIPACLNEHELLKAAKYTNPKAKTQYINTRSQVKHILAKYLNIQAGLICFDETNAKPKLANQKSVLEFNISHSNQYALLGISHHPIGVDLEFIKPIKNLDSLSNRSFTKKEHQHFLTLNSDQQQAYFYQLWTQKEAYAKMLGESVWQHLKTDTHSPKPSQYQIINPDGYQVSISIQHNDCKIVWINQTTPQT